jgi:hypothetical protein
MRFLTLICCFYFLNTTAQDIYPQDYFNNPLDIDLVLSGSFGELRSNHFHSGLDIKTQGREGLNVNASAEGYVSRIKLSHYGYGKAIYITHPNGYTTVYGHLKDFSETIDKYIREKQYTKETYEIELFPTPSELVLKQGELIAYSGNTGGSGGPHLHFEIRDNEERTLNPMLFGLTVKDTRLPEIDGFYAYPLNDTSHVNGFNSKQKIRLAKVKNGTYNASNITAYGQIGFGIESTDQHDMAYNNNGVYKIETFYNGVSNFKIDFDRFSFDESKHINQYIDFEHYYDKRKRIQKLFRDVNNPLSLFKKVVNEGVLSVSLNNSHLYKVKVSDFDTNTTEISVNINPEKLDEIVKEEVLKTNRFIKRTEINEVKGNNISVTIPKYTFYKDDNLDVKISSDTIQMLPKNKALNNYMTVSFDISSFKNKDADGLYIAELVGWNNFPSYSSTKRIGDVIYTKTKTLGTYTIAFDTDKPTISSINFTNGKWISNHKTLELKINDATTGISNYRATVNGKFILMEYDYKTKTLTHYFSDNKVTDTENNLKLIVTDNVGNSTTFEATFFRK